MRIEQCCWTGQDGWRTLDGADTVGKPHAVIYFAAPGTLESGDRFAELRQRYPEAHLVGCTTGGEILADDVLDDSIVATAIEFEKARTRLDSFGIGADGDSYRAGLALGKSLNGQDLRGLFVLSDGVQVNGSELVRGLTDVVGEDIPITGGLAGDGARFGKTLVGADANPDRGRIAALGFYGPGLDIEHGTMGGWSDFGPQRTITRSDGNVLHELDGKCALDLYKRYLGNEAKNLPGSALLFPLKVRPKGDEDRAVVRTVVGVDEEKGTMTFAGDVPEGYVAQLMYGNQESLIEGAAEAARMAAPNGRKGRRLAMLISCIGRRLLLGQRTVEEVEAVAEVVGAGIPRIGFYSYGEISPHAATGFCELHNQTMTITVLSET